MQGRKWTWCGREREFAADKVIVPGEEGHIWLDQRLDGKGHMESNRNDKRCIHALEEIVTGHCSGSTLPALNLKMK